VTDPRRRTCHECKWFDMPLCKAQACRVGAETPRAAHARANEASCGIDGKHWEPKE
jgi:hypothetical protein